MSISTRNIKPSSTSSDHYASVHTYGTKYGEFKYGAKKYGAATETSGGQRLPSINTRTL